MKKSILGIATVLFGLNGFGATTDYLVQRDAHNLKVGSKKLKNIVVGHKQVDTGRSCPPDYPFCNYEDVEIKKPGLVVELKYTAKGAGRNLVYDGYWVPTDSGRITARIPGAKEFVGAKIVQKVVTGTTVDQNASVYCARDYEGNITPGNCEDHIVMKPYQEMGTVIEVETK